MASSLRLGYAIRLSFAGHSLLGDQNHIGRNDQNGANHIEDRGTNTTGAGKDGAFVVHYILSTISIT